MRRWRRRLGFVALGLGTILGLGYAWYWHRYPYGWSHSCDKCLMFALDEYAREHGGAYPSGKASPEASLSLLYPKYADAEILHDKTVPRAAVQATLDGGGRVSPETCGWHCVEGLTNRDDRRLALVWDKVGLGHNGERTPDGGRTVLRVNLGYEYIPGAEWPEFLARQQELSANRQ